MLDNSQLILATLNHFQERGQGSGNVFAAFFDGVVMRRARAPLKLLSAIMILAI